MINSTLLTIPGQHRFQGQTPTYLRTMEIRFPENYLFQNHTVFSHPSNPMTNQYILDTTVNLWKNLLKFKENLYTKYKTILKYFFILFFFKKKNTAFISTIHIFTK